MTFALRLLLFLCLLQVTINQIFAYDKTQCYPYGFNRQTEEQEFTNLIFIPNLNSKSIAELSRLQKIPDDNPRYNEFLSCLWKQQDFQLPSGFIEFDKVESALGRCIARDLGETGPAINLSNVEAKKIIEECKNLGGLTHGQKVVKIRNCILERVGKFGEI